MLRVSLTASRYLAGLLAAAHAGMAAVVLTLDVTVAVKIALEILIAMSAYHTAWQGALLRSGRSIDGFEFDREGRVNVRSRLHGWQEAQLLGSTFVSPVLTILNVKVAGERLARHVVILPDSLPCEDFLQLRVLLRWPKRAAGAEPDN
ncbi:MAG TPA: protein YgfX [Burkholderiales bacterium]|nr:protein YgfX [Burkholderiales bacterium]